MTVTIGRVALGSVRSIVVGSTKDAEDFAGPSGLGRMADGLIASRAYELEGVEVGAGAATIMEDMEREHRRRGDVYVEETNTLLPEGYYKIVDFEQQGETPGVRLWTCVLREQRDPVVWRQAEDDNVAGADIALLSAEENVAVEGADLLQAHGLGTTAAAGTLSVPLNGFAQNGVILNPTGDRVYVVDTQPGEVIEYTLDVPFDVTSQSSSQTFSLTAEIPQFQHGGFWFRPNGKTFWIVDLSTNNIEEYAMSTAWDLSTASHSATRTVAATNWSTISFNKAGTIANLIAVGGTAKAYNLSTAWDLSTATERGTIPFSDVRDVSFSDDELLAFVYRSDAKVTKYALTTAGDLTTATSLQTTATLTSNTGAGIHMTPDGYRMILHEKIDANNNRLIQYDIGDETVVLDTLAAAGEKLALSEGTWRPSLRYQVRNDTYVEDERFLYLGGDGEIKQYRLDAAGDLSAATLVHEDTTGSGTWGVVFGADGRRYYEFRQTTGTIQQYDLDTPWDLSKGKTSAGSASITDVSGETAFAISADGRRVFILDPAAPAIRQYGLSTPWDVSTHSFEASFALTTSGFETSMTFTPDGLRVLVGLSSETVAQITLTTPWDITTATVTRTANWAAYLGANPGTLVYNADGTKVWAGSFNDNHVDEIALSTPYDISTASGPTTRNFPSSQEFRFATLARTPIMFRADATLAVDSVPSASEVSSSARQLATPSEARGVWKEQSFDDVVVTAGDAGRCHYDLKAGCRGDDFLRLDRVRLVRVA